MPGEDQHGIDAVYTNCFFVFDIPIWQYIIKYWQVFTCVYFKLMNLKLFLVYFCLRICSKHMPQNHTSITIYSSFALVYTEAFVTVTTEIRYIYVSIAHSYILVTCRWSELGLESWMDSLNLVLSCLWLSCGTCCVLIY